MSVRGAVKMRLLGLAERAGACTLRLVRARHGGVAVITALALPPLLLVGLGAFQLQAVFNDRQVTQDVADAASLWGAQQLSTTPVGAEQRTIAFAAAQLSKVKANASLNIKATVVGKSTIKVEIDTHRDSFFMNLMPVGGFNTHVESIAEGISLSPLCVITFGTSSSDKAEITGQSKLVAPNCLVHVNERVEVSGAALLQADSIEAGAGASGPMSPAASVGAPDIDDPFVGVDIDGPLLCLGLLGKQEITTSTTLAAGAHCRDVEVRNGATVTLAPGEHYFAKQFKLTEGAKLFGEDVVVIYGSNAVNDWKDGSSVILRGRKTGRLAGFVIAAARNRLNDMKLDSDSIEELTGTIYVPRAVLHIEGGQQAAQASDWTVMAVQALKLTNQPQVQINANYAGSEVPVPGGVGNRSGMARLTQ